MSEISVIIPVYNASKYLRRCLDSLLAQTYGDWTAVCVDDGSTDDSGKILDEYAARDGHFIVIHKPNGGVSEARNTGIMQARGCYVTYLDSDDFLHPQAFEICHFIIKREKPDLIAYTYDRFYRTRNMVSGFLGFPIGQKKNFSKLNTEELEYKKTNDIYAYATEYSHPEVDADRRKWLVKHCQPWRCMYRREIVANLRFIPGIIYEDFPWWGEVLLNVDKAVILNQPLYFYYANMGSYILSSQPDFRIESLRRAIEASERVYADVADDYKRTAWERNFLTPFREKLAKKTKKIKVD